MRVLLFLIATVTVPDDLARNWAMIPAVAVALILAEALFRRPPPPPRI